MRLRPIIPFLCLAAHLNGQSLFSFKQNGLWGWIDREGQVAIPAQFAAVTAWDAFGYAAVQQSGNVGLIDTAGKWILSPEYDWIKVLSENLITARRQEEWWLYHPGDQLALPFSAQEFGVFQEDEIIRFRIDDHWGLCDPEGRMLAPPVYSAVIPLGNGNFRLNGTNHTRIWSKNADTHWKINGAVDTAILLPEHRVLLYKKEGRWGLGRDGIIEKQRFESWNQSLSGYLQWYLPGGQVLLYHLESGYWIGKNEQISSWQRLGNQMVVGKSREKLGLWDASGRMILPVQFDEIQLFTDTLFRVLSEGQWQLVRAGGTAMGQEYWSYLGAPRDGLALCRRDRLCGLLDLEGRQVIPPKYQRIEWSNGQIKAFRGQDKRTTMEVFEYNEQGNWQRALASNEHFVLNIGNGLDLTGGRSFGRNTLLENEEVIGDFEWFYDLQQGKWGLRRRDDGTIEIKPTFVSITIRKDLGITLVFMEKPSRIRFEYTPYRFDRAFGIVWNPIGKLITAPELLDLRLEDWENGSSVARCVFANGRMGLMSRKGKILKRDCAYIGPFHNGLARISLQGRLSGNLQEQDTIGSLPEFVEKMILPSDMEGYTVYDRKFAKNAFLTCQDCSWGYIDTAAQMRVAPDYEMAEDPAFGRLLVRLAGKWGALDTSGQEMLKPLYDRLQLAVSGDQVVFHTWEETGHYGVIDTSGQTKVQAQFQSLGNFSEKWLSVRQASGFGFVDPTTGSSIACRFQATQDFQEGMAAVKMRNRWGYISSTGEEQIPFRFLRAGSFSGSLAPAAASGNYGYISTDGEWKIAPQFQQAFPFESGIARVSIKSRFGLIDSLGQWILKPSYRSISSFNEYGLAVVRLPGGQEKYGILNRQGKTVHQRRLERIGAFSEGLAPVQINGKWGYIDTSGQMVIPAVFSKAAGFSEGLAAVQSEQCCGYIDSRGRQAIPCRYGRCEDFQDGKAIVAITPRETGLIDTEGRWIQSPTLNRLVAFQGDRGVLRLSSQRSHLITGDRQRVGDTWSAVALSAFGSALYRHHGGWGLLDQKGFPLTRPKYSRLGWIAPGLAWVQVKSKQGLADLKGHWLLPPGADYIEPAGQGIFLIETGGKIGYLHADGHWVKSLQQ